MDTNTALWFMLTPAGGVHAFSQSEPTPEQTCLQSLLTGDRALDLSDWTRASPLAAQLHSEALAKGWIQSLGRPMQGPDANLDDFLQHVIAALSGERRAVLASGEGFCLGRAGIEQDEADALSAAAADFGDFSTRQARRGWDGAATGFVSFHRDAEFLLPSVSFMPFWVDGTGYWLILGGEPLVNNPALVELFWGLKVAGTRFQR